MNKGQKTLSPAPLVRAALAVGRGKVFLEPNPGFRAELVTPPGAIHVSLLRSWCESHCPVGDNVEVVPTELLFVFGEFRLTESRK